MNLNHFFWRLYSDGDFDVKYKVEDVYEVQVGIDNVEGLVNDDSGNSYDNDSGDGSDDSDYNVEESRILYNVDVDICEFHSVVDVDKHEIFE